MDRPVGWSPGYLATQKPGNLAAAAHLSSAQPSAAHSSAQRSPAQLIAQLSSAQFSSARLSSIQLSSAQYSSVQLSLPSAQLSWDFVLGVDGPHTPRVLSESRWCCESLANFIGCELLFRAFPLTFSFFSVFVFFFKNRQNA